MKDNYFKIIYEILDTLRKSLDVEEFDKSVISYEALNVSEPRWHKIMFELYNNGYISGVETKQSFKDNYPKVILIIPSITLKGMEYLQENSVMKRIYKSIRGTKDII